MSAAWSGAQRRALDALGFVVYRTTTSTTPMAAPAAPVAPAAPADRRLLEALLRAAGADPASLADGVAWLAMRGVPPVAELRGDAAAKRALWPRLRGLRARRASR